MPYLIDGHNLIPKVPGLALQNIDDETQLIELLLEFCRRKRKEAVVFFDQAPVGYPRARNYGNVKAHFVRESQTADSAIQARLLRLGRQARNWTVVSSDRAVQAAARAARAHFISSEVFAEEMTHVLRNSSPEPGKKPDSEVSPEDIDSWMEMFGVDPRDE